MSSGTLNPTTNEILKRCPRFRILLVGKSGVGKSSLINTTFSVDIATVSHKSRGECDINEEIHSPQNPRFVLHDSQGFEANETSNLEKVKKFIRSRSGDELDLKDRVHAVWLCIQIPYAGGRVFEKGDEEFLEFTTQHKVPIIVVFTQFDRLFSRMQWDLTDEELKMEENEINNLCLQRANAEFEMLCLGPLRKVDSKVDSRLAYEKTSAMPTFLYTLKRLVNRTQFLLEHQMEGDIWIVSAMAQRASAQTKIDSSIAVGMKKYWQSLVSSVHFSDSPLRECLSTIHMDITSNWNFYDPDNLLNSDDFQDKILALVQLVTPDDSEVKSWFQGVENIQSLTSVVSLIAPLAPAIAAIGLSAMFIRWVTSIYQKTPKALRCLMGYIVNLTLVMDQLFLITLTLKPPRRLTKEKIDQALEGYVSSEAVHVHRTIREYANDATFAQLLRANNAQQKVIELIHQYQAPSVNTPFGRSNDELQEVTELIHPKREQVTSGRKATADEDVIEEGAKGEPKTNAATSAGHESFNLSPSDNTALAQDSQVNSKVDLQSKNFRFRPAVKRLFSTLFHKK